MSGNRFVLAACAALPFSLIYLDGPATAWVREFNRQQSALQAVVSLASRFLAVAQEPAMVVCAFFVLAWGWRYRRRRSFEMGRALLISYACAGVLVQILKHLIGRARPRITDAVLFIGPTLKGGYDSFPSGHTTVAFCFAYTLAQYLPRHRYLIYAAAAVAGTARIASASHFVSDVVAGAAVGTVAGKLLWAYVMPRLAARGSASASS